MVKFHLSSSHSVFNLCHLTLDEGSWDWNLILFPSLPSLVVSGNLWCLRLLNGVQRKPASSLSDLCHSLLHFPIDVYKTHPSNCILRWIDELIHCLLNFLLSCWIEILNSSNELPSLLQASCEVVCHMDLEGIEIFNSHSILGRCITPCASPAIRKTIPWLRLA